MTSYEKNGTPPNLTDFLTELKLPTLCDVTIMHQWILAIKIMRGNYVQVYIESKRYINIAYNFSAGGDSHMRYIATEITWILTLFLAITIVVTSVFIDTLYDVLPET